MASDRSGRVRAGRGRSSKEKPEYIGLSGISAMRARATLSSSSSSSFRWMGNFVGGSILLQRQRLVVNTVPKTDGRIGVGTRAEVFERGVEGIESWIPLLCC